MLMFSIHQKQTRKRQRKKSLKANDELKGIMDEGEEVLWILAEDKLEELCLGIELDKKEESDENDSLGKGD